MINEDDVKKLARLAFLQPDAKQVASLTRQLDSIIQYMEQINKVDVTNVDPTSHTQGSTNVFRDDVIGEHLSIEKTLSNAPDKVDRFIRVPIIVDAPTGGHHE